MYQHRNHTFFKDSDVDDNAIGHLPHFGQVPNHDVNDEEPPSLVPAVIVRTVKNPLATNVNPPQAIPTNNGLRT